MNPRSKRGEKHMNDMFENKMSQPDSNIAQLSFSAPVYEVPPPRNFTTGESVFAWISFIAAYLFCRVFPVANNPFGGFLFIIALFTATFVSLKIKGVKLGTLALLAAASAVVVSACLIVTANAFLHSYAYLYALVAYCYFVYTATGNSVQNGFSDFLAIDFFKALFVLPFYSMDQLFKAMFYGKARGSGKFLIKLIIGIAVAIVPTVIVLVLLSYDEGFSEILSKIFDFNLFDIFSHIVSLGFAIPIGMYLFGLFVSAVDNKCSEVITEKTCRAISEKIKVAPAVTVIAAVVPMLFLYVVFFISQWKYYVSGFTGELPDKFSYASYAREGFFQLCAVSVINLIIIISVVLFMRRKSDRPSVLLKILALVYSGFTLVLISTAVAKMIMYIDCYGLTQKRVYATWLMAVLAVLFILIAVRQFVPRFNAVAASLAACVILFSGLALSNVDSVIAGYNVDRYIDGSLETLDVYALEKLGDAAIPELVRLAEELDRETGRVISRRRVVSGSNDIYDQLVEVLYSAAEQKMTEEKGIFSFTVPSLKARKALERINLIK